MTAKKDAASLIDILQVIRNALNEDAALSDRVGLQIKETGQNEKRRYAQLLSYQGPDSTTMAILESNHVHWLHQPARFWQRPAAPDLAHLVPQAQIIGCFLQTEPDDA